MMERFKLRTNKENSYIELMRRYHSWGVWIFLISIPVVFTTVSGCMIGATG